MKVRLPPRRRVLHNSLTEFDIQREVGFGAFSHVYKAHSFKLGKEVALKIFSMDKLCADDQLLVANEIEIHSQLNSPLVVGFHDYFVEDDRVCLVLDYAANGNFYTYIKIQRTLPVFEIARYFRQVVEGLVYLHGKGIIFRDLKPENLVMDEQRNLKFCDFGWATTLQNLHFRCAKAGTLVYMSPESIAGLMQDEKTDIWALGILVYEMFFNKEPYSALTQPDLMYLIQNSTLDFSAPINPLPPVFATLIKRMLTINPSLRPSAAELLSVDFTPQNLQPASASGFFRFSKEHTQPPAPTRTAVSPSHVPQARDVTFYSPNINPSRQTPPVAQQTFKLPNPTTFPPTAVNYYKQPQLQIKEVSAQVPISLSPSPAPVAQQVSVTYITSSEINPTRYEPMKASYVTAKTSIETSSGQKFSILDSSGKLSITDASPKISLIVPGGTQSRTQSPTILRNNASSPDFVRPAHVFIQSPAYPTNITR